MKNAAIASPGGVEPGFMAVLESDIESTVTAKIKFVACHHYREAK